MESFVENKDKIHGLVADPTLKTMTSYSFLPLMKIVSKTPRYRYNEKLDKYKLDTKKRPISFASHFDTYIYGFYSFALNDLYQKKIKDLGFDSSVK